VEFAMNAATAFNINSNFQSLKDSTVALANIRSEFVIKRTL
jgi:hypothetical protein